MTWKKLLDTKELIAYEKSTKISKVRIEARYKKCRWRIYKTYNFKDNGEWVSHVKEYIATSLDEAKDLVTELKKEKDVLLEDVNTTGVMRLDLKRCYKEDFVEKWKFTIDDFNYDNFVIIRYDSEVKMDIVLHDRYNDIEKQILEKLISTLGLKDVSNKIRYDFFYFKKHSAKRRIYQKLEDKELVAQFEFNLGNMNNQGNLDTNKE